MIVDNVRRSFGARALAIWGLALCLATGCASVQEGGKRETKGGADGPRGKLDNVPVNVLVIGDDVLGSGDYTELVAIFSGPIKDANQYLHIESHFVPSYHQATKPLWEIAPDVDDLLPIQTQVWRKRIRVSPQFDGRGIITLEACTRTGAGNCANNDGRKLIAVLINPVNQNIP